MNRKVIFVGGTEFSGSTFFHLMLANDPKGFACGELVDLFYPWRKGHVNRWQDFDSHGLRIWRQVFRNGEDHAFETIFEMYPHLEFLVDSSKDPLWIRYQADNLRKKKIETCHVAIWKSPLEFAHSKHKRNRLPKWEKEWTEYYRIYFKLVEKWRSVKYQTLAKSTGIVLEQVCQYLEIPFFRKKLEFWQRNHYHLGGNYSARIHLETKTGARKYLSEWIENDRMKYYRKIYYRDVRNENFAEYVEGKLNETPHMEQVLRVLEAFSVAHGKISEHTLEKLAGASATRQQLSLKRLKWTVKRTLGRHRYLSSVSTALERGNG